MDKLNRIADLQRIFNARRTPIPLRRLMDQLGVSESTARRLLQSYRDDFGAPLIFDRSAGGWRLDDRLQGEDGRASFLPGFWFKPDELHALLSAHEALRQIEPGLLAAQVAPLAERIARILEAQGLDRAEVARRIRVRPSGARNAPAPVFAAVARALLERRVLRFGYRARGQEAPEERTGTRRVSPQRLFRYRSNWYLATWCHGSEAIKTFAVERIGSPRIEDEPAHEVPDAEIDAELGDSYGIFAGPATGTALIRFSAWSARWVAEESWHPRQQGRHLPDGRYELAIPYSQPQELLMDILRYGPEAEILEPPELREAARRQLEQALAAYA